MKTKKQVLSDNEEFKPIINAVIRQLGGMERISDINAHGIDGGYGRFVYYSDTVPFAHMNRNQIIKLLEYDANSMGIEVVEMVSNFGTFRRSQMDTEDRRDLYRFLSGVRCKETTIPNLMAWYAAETVCRMFED